MNINTSSISIFKLLQRELFYFSRLIKERHPFSHFVNYAKNRYFGNFRARKIKPLACVPRADFEMHILSQRFMVWPLLMCIHSFCYHSELCPKVIVHDDGSFDNKTAALLEKKCRNAKVLRKSEADKLIESRRDIPDFIKQYRKGSNKIIIKLIDGFLLSNAKNVMIVGNDVLFYSKPKEIIDFVNGGTKYQGLASFEPKDWPLDLEEDFVKRMKIREKGAHQLNSDLLVFRKDLLPLDILIDYFKHTKKPDGYFIDMAGFSALFSQLDFKFLPFEKYTTKNPLTENIIAKHFTSPIRHQLYANGIDEALKRMK